MHIHFHVEKPEKTLTDAKVNSVCPMCKKIARIRIIVIQPYVTIFFIPMAPVFKEKVVRGICSNCDARFSQKYFTDALNQRYRELKKRPPLSMFTGTGILLILTAGIIAVIIMMKNMEAQAVLNAQQEDVYTIRLDADRFTLIKVSAVKNDSVYLVKNRFETNGSNGFDELYDKQYDTVVKVVPIAQIKEWYDSNFIVGVVPHD